MKKFILYILLSIIHLGAYSQVIKSNSNIFLKYINNIINDTNDLSAPKFMNYPTLAFSPETNWEIGLSSLYIYSANRDLKNRLSEIKAFTFYTLENQYGIWLDHALYSNGNKWFFFGRTRCQSFPLLYYGIGGESPTDHIARIDGNFTYFKERFLREVFPNFYTGIEFDVQVMNKVSYKNSLNNFSKPKGGNGSTNIGLGWGFVYNNIHNVLNPRKGIFSEWAFLNYSSEIGSDYNLTTFLSDNRFYIPIKNNNVLAFQFQGQFTNGNPPFNLLSLMGGESLMRGYYLGRYRDKHLLAGQVEYRMLPFSFSKRWGASLFCAAGEVFNSDNKFQFKNLLPTGGAGLRFLLFPEKDIYTRIDYALTREGSGFYFFIGEAF
ncbi:MAG: BamA/TamA family outer membrane protein [Flavobacteriales bacterium]